ncbi:MAG: (Fe-S)-binding protein [Myxococcota bacterium]
MSELVAIGRKAPTLCAYCPKMCRFACPIAEAESRETVTPWGKMSVVYWGQRGDPVAASKDAHRVLEACTGCGACAEHCAHGNPVAETLFAARGAVHTARGLRLRERFRATGHGRHRDPLPALHRLESSATARIRYFPGCTRLLQQPSRCAHDIEALSLALGEKVPAMSLPRGPACCGYPLHADGQHDILTEHLRIFEGQVHPGGTLVTPDPGCAYVLDEVRRQRLGPRSDVRWPTVTSVAEFLGGHGASFAGRSAGLEVRYHDPCYLGRRRGQYSGPRQLLTWATGREPLEFVFSHAHADCSGAGGLYPTSDLEGALRVAARRAGGTDGSPEPNAGVPVVTACPSAQRLLQRAGIVVHDLVDVLLGRSGDE